MKFNRCALLSKLVCLPSLLIGCGTLGTYYPKNSASPAVVRRDEGRTRQQTSAADKRTDAEIGDQKEVFTTIDALQPEVSISQPVIELSREIVPVEFEETSVEIQNTSSVDPSPAIPLPEPEEDITPLNATGMTLEELESIALSNNPTIKELAATTQKAAGYRTQVTAKPNPLVGYQGQQLADQGTDQHLAFVEREFVTGGKLQLNRRVLNAALAAQLQELEAQRLRVKTDIRIRFYQALALQRQLGLINDFTIVAEQGLRIAELRKEAGEGSQVDVLQSRIQLNEVSLAQQQTQAKLAAIWREISALAGIPHLPQSTLVGELPTETPERDWQQLAGTLAASSPEYAAAQVRITRACANLQRQLKQPIPNVSVQMGAGVDNSTNSGMLNLQFGVPLPLNNNNQGNIVAASAEVSRARMDAQRIANDIEARLAVVSREYETAVAAVNQYAMNILPDASSSMKLAEQAYEAGEAGFVQILIARRTFFDSNLQYVSAQSDLAAAQAKIDGFVLTGALNAVRDESGDDSLRGETFSQQ